MNKNVTGCLTFGGVFGVAVILVWVLLKVFIIRQVDAGNVGILVNYGLTNNSGKPQTSIVLPGNFEWINPLSGQFLIEYPVQQQSLVMVQNGTEGEIQGDDSVTCQDKNGVSIKLDVTQLWQVNPAEAGKLYFLRPNQPLTGSFNNDIESTVVRPVVRNAVTAACSTDSWDSIGAHKVAIAATALQQIQATLSEDGIVVPDNSLLIGEVHYSQTQENAIAAKATAQQQAEAAQYDQQKAQYEAQAIKTLNDALANNPNYIQYLAVQKWDGHLPQVTGTGAIPFLKGVS